MWPPAKNAEYWIEPSSYTTVGSFSPPPTASWPEEGVEMVPEHLRNAWEAAYRDYVAMAQQPNTIRRQDRVKMAQLSARVAVTWRRIANTPGLEWSLVAAFGTAAEAFERQAVEFSELSKR
jgi:hypothetical protein